MRTKGHKVPQMYIQIFEWFIALNIINGFERLHKFTEEEKRLMGCFRVIVAVASLKVLLV